MGIFYQRYTRVRKWHLTVTILILCFISLSVPSTPDCSIFGIDLKQLKLLLPKISFLYSVAFSSCYLGLNIHICKGIYSLYKNSTIGLISLDFFFFWIILMTLCLSDTYITEVNPQPLISLDSECKCLCLKSISYRVGLLHG